MSKSIGRRITAIILALVMVIGLIPAMTMTAYAEEAAAISLVASDNFTFDEATEGYSAQAPYQVQVRSVGTGDTGDLNVTLEGNNPEAFVLSTNSFSSLSTGGSGSFDVVPASGLSAGTYKAVVTVSGSNITSKSFNVSFTVNSAGTTYTAQICTYIDNSPADVTGDVELLKDSSVITVPKTGTGIYETAVPSGDYTIFINGIATGRHINVSSAGSNVTLNYFTVNFSATYYGTATGSSVGASVDGASINSGDKVLSGKTVTITASGNGAGSYTYTWSGDGTSDETTATISINLDRTVNAACAVTGIGTPLETPDYEINGEGYKWTGSVQTVVLSGANDRLTIHKAPTAAVRIEAQSADGSEVTIEGNSIECSNTTVVVSNAITLNLSDFHITAPAGSMQDWRLFTGLLLKKSTTINVTGTCHIAGSANNSMPFYGYGIASDQDTTLRITGNGTLNATGGSSNNGNGGAGIVVITNTYGMESGSKLIIDDGVTVNAIGGDSQNFLAGAGIIAEWGDITISNATVSAKGGVANGGSNGGGAGIQAASNASKGGNITIINSTVTAEGGFSATSGGGRGMYAFTEITITDSTVTTKGGSSAASGGGIGMNASANITITGGMVISTGGNGYVNGAHGIFSNQGAIIIAEGADLRAVGGNGANDVGGVGLRAAGNDGVTLHGNTVTIANSAGNVYIRGGQGKTGQRASVMGKDVYIGMGNVGSVVMEGTNARSIKNVAGGSDVYLVNVTANPAETVEIRCVVKGLPGGEYTYRAVTADDGTACLWLPEGAQALEATGYEDTDLTVAASDTSNTVTLSKPSVVTAHDSEELNTYMAEPGVTTINLVSGTTYNYDGTTVARALTINGNGAVINVGMGIDDTIIKKEGNTVTGKVFLAVQSGSLTIKDVTLRDISSRILAAVNVKTGGTLLLDGVTFEGFFANLSTDSYPDSQNMPGSYNNFGVHAEPGAVSTTVKNCTFGSSNSFRNTIAIRNGVAVITDNTFVGTATPDRQNQTDGFEYAVYLYGGSCTVTGNDIRGYDSIIKQIGYHSAGISTCPYYPLTATITGNRLRDNARGIDGVGAWHTYSYPADVKINGIVLDSSENAFTIGQELKAGNLFSGNTDGNIALALDQNDNYIDAATGTEYGPTAYCDTFLKLGSTSSSSARLSFDTGNWAQSMIRNAKSFGMQVSKDNGTTWQAASIAGTLNSSSTAVTVNLTPGKTYLLRAVLTITTKTMPYGSETDVYTDADIVCYSNTVRVTITSGSTDPTTPDPTTQNPTIPNTTKDLRQVNVNGVGNTSSDTIATIDIVRKTTDGKKMDSVVLDQSKTEEVIRKVVEQKRDKVQIVAEDIPDDPADELAVTVNKNSVKQLSDNRLALEIKNDEVSIRLPAASLQKLTGSDEDLYFRVVPIRNVEQKAETIKEAITAGVVLQAANGGQVVALGIPMTIETNYKSISTKIAFSLKGITIPDQKAQREAFLSNLGVYINHSDGEQELNRGTIIYDEKGNPAGIEIEINKFSTFTIVGTANIAPVASEVKISGKEAVGNTLTATYTYNDRDQDEEGATLIQWYRADNKSGKNMVLVAVGATYQVTSKDQGNYLIVTVTPEAKTGTRKGAAVTAVTKSVVTNSSYVYKSYIKLGLIGNKSYAQRVARIFETDYKAGNVKVVKEGKYYRVYLDFVDREAAQSACLDMKKRKYIVNFYFYKK